MFPRNRTGMLIRDEDKQTMDMMKEAHRRSSGSSWTLWDEVWNMACEVCTCGGACQGHKGDLCGKPVAGSCIYSSAGHARAMCPECAAFFLNEETFFVSPETDPWDTKSSEEV